jgi:hypothetical protein
MQLKVGQYSFDANAVKIATSVRTMMNEGGYPYEELRRMEFDGYLSATGQAALSLASSALATALRKPYQDIIFYNDSGVATMTKLLNSESISGVVVVDGPNFPDSNGGEYATFRRFTFAAEASFPLPNTQAILLSFQERLTFSGGGPIYRHRMAINGRPQKQLVYPSSIYRATQEGRAVGYRATPLPPQPLWPNALMQSPNESVQSPRRRGRLAYSDYEVSWQYQFESDQQLVGTPTQWRG